MLPFQIPAVAKPHESWHQENCQTGCKNNKKKRTDDGDEVCSLKTIGFKVAALCTDVNVTPLFIFSLSDRLPNNNSIIQTVPPNFLHYCISGVWFFEVVWYTDRPIDSFKTVGFNLFFLNKANIFETLTKRSKGQDKVAHVRHFSRFSESRNL